MDAILERRATGDAKDAHPQLVRQHPGEILSRAWSQTHERMYTRNGFVSADWIMNDVDVSGQ